MNYTLLIKAPGWHTTAVAALVHEKLGQAPHVVIEDIAQNPDTTYFHVKVDVASTHAAGIYRWFGQDDRGQGAKALALKGQAQPFPPGTLLLFNAMHDASDSR